MDLRSVLNTSDGGDRAPAKPAPKPQPPPQHIQQPHPQQHQMHRPSQSPAQAPAPPPYYREYNRQQPPPHPSPGKPMPQEYLPHAGHPHHPQSRPPSHHQPSPHQPPPGAYPPQSPYQTPGPYPGRPVPPPLQPAGSFHDARSPSGPTPGQSPYRASTTPSAASAAAGYPFPHTQSPADVASPVQRHQHSPAQYAPRESFSQGPQAAPPGQVHGHYPATQQQQHHQSSVPQTPPVGAPGNQQYLNQRPPSAPHSAHSTHSTPTPTSAHPQHPYGPSFIQGSSPVVASRPPPGEYGHSRQPSQPATPSGPLSSGSRQTSIPGVFAQPSSPYQQRLSYTTAAPVAQAQTQVQAQVKSSPPPPPPPTKRISSSYGSPAPDAHRRSQSRSERAPSQSVSPKSRVHSLHSNPDPLAALAAADAKNKQSHTASIPQPMAIDTERAATPAKRKLEDRIDSSPKQEPEEKRMKPNEVNGIPTPVKRESESDVASTTSGKKRRRYSQPPIWAQDSRRMNAMPSNANFVLQKRLHSHINGKQEQNTRPSRHASPETNRAVPAAHPAPPAEPSPNEILGPWEPSITGVKPFEDISRKVADFLFLNVLNAPDMGEISSRGIQFEVEAKLGTLIDKDTRHRVDRGIASECVLLDSSRIKFESSMTEAAHKKNNDFLNEIVKSTHPRGPGGANHRVPVVYKHRRERDRFFDLPPDLQARIPGCVRSRLGKWVKCRVTYDQKTNEVLGKIIKARIADLDIHFPLMPMDCRISINLEMDWDGPLEELEHIQNPGDNPDRNKDRLSYTQGPYQIDLTQVTHAGQGGRAEKNHELEIELDPKLLIDQGRKAAGGAAHRYPELVEGFVDNIRVLARKARDFEQQ
ncbi:CYTH-like domain-containing protein [Fusarium flagelliforme]|uniref:mRNA-capping enzyme subunit beta n=1 Tax=Fusarium flagelliforme TaxID=2675880 RepID=A0A395N1F7_9HYPO|nr:CYTH-like domain-containing protein [Fusarium flagelliforme]KAH7179785.1 CYTH-like domain-containing protein [Fusarium flagelliforme]RFN53790.1 mrna-capping enzyme subunit beta [Fusarium flagelliforme]